MTTNAGAQESSRASVGFTTQDHSTDSMEVLKKLFSPEFRNRLDAIIQFEALEDLWNEWRQRIAEFGRRLDSWDADYDNPIEVLAEAKRDS